MERNWRPSKNKVNNTFCTGVVKSIPVDCDNVTEHKNEVTGK